MWKHASKIESCTNDTYNYNKTNEDAGGGKQQLV